MDVIEGNKGIAEPETSFRFHEQLNVAKKDIEQYYEPAEKTVYRTFINNPPTEQDFTPQLFRDNDGNDASSILISQEEYNNLPLQKKKVFIAERGLSVNETKEQAIEAARYSYKNVETKHGTEGAELYIEEQRGRYVGEIRLKPGQALVSKTGIKGHFTILLNQDVNWKDIDVSGIVEYEYKDE